MDMASPVAAQRTTEEEMLPGLLAGDGLAFEVFVRQFCDPMYYVARRILRNDDDALEAIQDAFLHAFRAMKNFQKSSRLSTWLHRIVINASLKKLRSIRRGPERSIEDFLPHFQDDEHHIVDPASFRSPVDVFASRREMATLLHQQIDKLPELYRTVVLLRDIEGLDTEETAAMLDISCGLVKTRLHRARQALRTLLEPYLKEVQP